jgi:hypothetical protein
LRSKVPESFFESRGGSGVFSERLGGGALLGAFTDLARTRGFGFAAGAGAVAAADAGRDRGLRWTARSAPVTDFLCGPPAWVDGLDAAASFACAAARRAAALVVRIVGGGFDAFGAVLLPCSVDAAVPGREVVGAACWVDEALRCFARSLCESSCEAIVSSIFAEPTTMDFGRGLRVAVLMGLRGTAACTVLVSDSFGLAGAYMEIGLVFFFNAPGRAVVDELVTSRANAIAGRGVAGLELFTAWKTSGPRDRLRLSCTLYMSSCMDERRRAGVPELFVLPGPCGLEGVAGEEKAGIVTALVGYGEEMGDTVVTRDGRSCPNRSPFRIVSFWGDEADVGVVSAVVTPNNGLLFPSSLMGVVAALSPFPSVLSLRTTCGLFNPSFSDILRSGVGILSSPVTGSGWILELLILWFAISSPILKGVETVEAFCIPTEDCFAGAGVAEFILGVCCCTTEHKADRGSCGNSGVAEGESADCEHLHVSEPARGAPVARSWDTCIGARSLPSLSLALDSAPHLFAVLIMSSSFSFCGLAGREVCPLGVPNKFFFRMSLTLPPVFTSPRCVFSGLGVNLPAFGVTLPSPPLPSVAAFFMSGVPARLSGVAAPDLGKIFFSGISIEK